MGENLEKYCYCINPLHQLQPEKTDSRHNMISLEDFVVSHKHALFNPIYYGDNL